MNKTKISSSQFFIMLFLLRVVMTVGLNTRYLGGENMLEAVVSCFLALLLSFPLAVPALLLCRRPPEPNATGLRERPALPLPPVYILYYLLSGGASLGLFMLFLKSSVNPEFSYVLAAIGVMLAAGYGAYKGIEGISRAALCVFALLLLGSGLVFFIVLFRFDGDNIEPLFRSGASQTLRGTLLFLSRCSVFTDMAVFLPMVNGRKIKGFSLWAVGVFFYMFALLSLIAGCLGPYAATQEFPVFALSSITEVRSMQRLDAVFAGVWLLGLSLKLAFSLYACRVCSGRFCRNKGPVIFLCGAVIFALALLPVSSEAVKDALLDYPLMLMLVLVTGVILPLYAVIKVTKRRKGEKKAK